MTATAMLSGTRIDVQRIFCIGRNYAAHAAELGNAAPGEPVVFMKPSSAIVPAGQDVHLPRNRGSVHHEAELVMLIGRDGATSETDIAGISLGLDLTLREEQASLKAKGLPWELAKAFDASAPLGEFVAAPADFGGIRFECHVNGALRQRGETQNMLFPVPRIIEFLSQRFFLRRGDLVFTGTPEGVGPLMAGDIISVASESIGRFQWRCA